MKDKQQFELLPDIERTSERTRLFLKCGCEVWLLNYYYLDVDKNKDIQRVVITDTKCDYHKVTSLDNSLAKTKPFTDLDDFLISEKLNSSFFNKMTKKNLLAYMDRALNKGDFKVYEDLNLKKDKENEEVVKFLEGMK